jgi:hypothetical protein
VTLHAEQVLRTGSVDDLRAVVALMDAAVRWPVSQGRSGQFEVDGWPGQLLGRTVS